MYRKFNFSHFFEVVLCLALLLSFAQGAQAATGEIAQPQVVPAQDGAPSEAEHSISISIVQCVDPAGAGYIDFVVKSWDSEGPGGLNSDIELKYQVKVGNVVSAYVTYMHGSFTNENHRRFGGTLYLSGSPDTVTLVATALAPWGNGHQPGAMDVKTVALGDCQNTRDDPEESETLRYPLFVPAVYR